jgi:hypothetical protein
MNNIEALKYIEIRRWDNYEIIVCGEYESVKDCLEKNKDKNFYRANLDSANLHSANLDSANLHSANLDSANLDSANLDSANLCSANLHSADLRWANLHSANLHSADLRWANLDSANLHSANLHSANLSLAKLDKRYIQISCIGSRKNMTTYCFEDDFIWCGCWSGKLEDFEKRVKETHENNKQYLDEYMGFIKYLRGLTK